MGMSIDEKIEEDLKHCSFNGVKYSDYVKEHYISKDQYEARLKADLMTMLTDIQLEIEEMQSLESECDYAIDECIYKYRVTDLIQQKINALKE